MLPSPRTKKTEEALGAFIEMEIEQSMVKKERLEKAVSSPDDPIHETRIETFAANGAKASRHDSSIVPPITSCSEMRPFVGRAFASALRIYARLRTVPKFLRSTDLDGELRRQGD